MNQFEELKKKIETFSTDFLDLNRLQKLLLEYISAINTQKDEIFNIYKDGQNNLHEMSNENREIFTTALEKQLTHVSEEVKRQYSDIETILKNFTNNLERNLANQIEELNDLNNNHKDFIKNLQAVLTESVIVKLIEKNNIYINELENKYKFNTKIISVLFIANLIVLA